VSGVRDREKQPSRPDPRRFTRRECREHLEAGRRIGPGEPAGRSL